MNSLFIVYSALAVFGIGVTIVDLFGVFEHAGHSGGDADDSGGAHDDAGADSGGHDFAHDDGGSDGHGFDHGDATLGFDHDGTDDDAFDGSGDTHDVAVHDGIDHDGAVHDHGHDSDSHHAGEHGSYVASADAGTRAVAKAIGALRTGVYFSLGAGPTGLFAILTGVQPVASLAWSAGAGLFIAVLARALRTFIRKDLDSSIKPAEFIMDEATITVPIAAGAMGRAAIRRYGTETEVYVRAKDPAAAFPKGAAVRIVDFDDDCYWIEPL